MIICFESPAVDSDGISPYDVEAPEDCPTIQCSTDITVWVYDVGTKPVTVIV